MKKGRFSRSWRKLLRRRDGTSAIELALILPVIAAMIVPLADLGMAAFTKMEVQNAAQAGADYALKNASGTFNATNIGTAVTSATALSGLTATPTPSESCACVSGTTITDTTAPPCSTGCASGTEGIYVTVGAQASYTPLFPYPTIPGAITFNATSQVRIK